MEEPKRADNIGAVDFDALGLEHGGAGSDENQYPALFTDAEEAALSHPSDVPSVSQVRVFIVSS